jgi:hypothetical protein
MGSWRKLQNEQQHNSYCTPDTTKAPINDKMGGSCNTHGKYEIVVGEPEGKRSLGRWETSVEIHIKEKGHENVDWTDLPEDVISNGLL